MAVNWTVWSLMGCSSFFLTVTFRATQAFDSWNPDSDMLLILQDIFPPACGRQRINRKLWSTVFVRPCLLTQRCHKMSPHWCVQRNPASWNHNGLRVLCVFHVGNTNPRVDVYGEVLFQQFTRFDMVPPTLLATNNIYFSASCTKNKCFISLLFNKMSGTFLCYYHCCCLTVDPGHSDGSSNNMWTLLFQYLLTL